MRGARRRERAPPAQPRRAQTHLRLSTTARKLRRGTALRLWGARVGREAALARIERRAVCALSPRPVAGGV